MIGSTLDAVGLIALAELAGLQLDPERAALLLSMVQGLAIAGEHLAGLAMHEVPAGPTPSPGPVQ
jgi:hypothetical protein